MHKFRPMIKFNITQKSSGLFPICNFCPLLSCDFLFLLKEFQFLNGSNLIISNTSMEDISILIGIKHYQVRTCITQTAVNGICFFCVVCVKRPLSCCLLFIKTTLISLIFFWRRIFYIYILYLSYMKLSDYNLIFYILYWNRCTL